MFRIRQRGDKNNAGAILPRRDDEEIAALKLIPARELSQMLLHFRPLGRKFLRHTRTPALRRTRRHAERDELRVCAQNIA